MATRRVIGTWRSFGDQSRAPVSGTITFRPTVLVRDKATKHIVVQDPVVVELDSNGSIDIQLQVTSDPNLEPEGWQWEVTEQITSRTARRYPLLIPAGTTPFDLSAVEVPPSAVFLDPQSLYLKGVQVGPTTVRNPNQPPTVDVTSKDSIATLKFQLPRAGAPAVGDVQVGTPAQGPAVTSTNTADGDPRFNFRLPRSRNVQAGTTSMVNPDQPAQLSTSQDANGDLTLDLAVPRAAEFTIGDVTTLTPDQEPDVTRTVTDGDVALDFDLPRAAVVTINTPASVVDPDQQPAVSSTTTDGDVEIQFTLPRAADVSLGTVAVVDNDQPPAITDIGTDGDVVLDVDLPQAKTLALGAVTVANPDQNPDIVDSGDVNGAVFDVTIPRAAAVTVDEPATVLNPDQQPAVGSTTTDGDVEIAFSLPRAPAVTIDTPATVLNPDQQPAVSSTTTDGDVEIAFSLPAAPTFTVGDVTTVGPSTPASTTDVGTNGNIVLDFALPRGEKGWAPVLAIVIDADRRVLQLTDWTGGEGTKPATGDYIGATGLVADIEDAVDIRGEQGPSGTGELDNLSDVIITSAVDGQILIYDDATGNWINKSPDTGDIAEGTNLYYTDARVEAVIAGSDTDDLAEGAANLYYTDQRADDRADARIAAATTDDLTEGAANLYYTDARVEAVIAGSDTDALAEGATNLYYTDARAEAAAPVQSVNTETGDVVLGPADVGALPDDADLGDLDDVDATGAAAGDVLAYDGTDWVPDPDMVRSADISTIVTLTQAEYDLLTPDPNTLYIVD